MQPTDWWSQFRMLMRQCGLQRHRLIHHSSFDNSQWVRLERGEGAPPSQTIQDVKQAFRRAAAEQSIAVPAALEDLPDVLESPYSEAEILEMFERAVRREIPPRERKFVEDLAAMTPRHQQIDAIRNCETIAMGNDHLFPNTGNFETVLQSIIDQRSRPSRVLWYASAGDDMRPLVFFSDHFQNLVRAQRENTVELVPKPDLFVFTCLDYSGGHPIRSSVGKTLYRDRRTEITVLSQETIQLNRQRFPFVKGYAFFGEDPRRGRPNGIDGVLLRVEVQSHQYGVREEHQLLYLFHENIHFWDTWIIGSGFFAPDKLVLDTLVCSREGLGMGGCSRSALIHWLEMPTDVQREFCPKHIVAFRDYTNGSLQENAQEEGYELTDLGPYIPERGGRHSDHFYRVNWPSTS